jgi:hypothetical protein
MSSAPTSRPSAVKAPSWPSATGKGGPRAGCRHRPLRPAARKLGPHKRHDLGGETPARVSVGERHVEEGEPGAPDADEPLGDGLPSPRSWPSWLAAIRSGVNATMRLAAQVIWSGSRPAASALARTAVRMATA